MSEVTYPVPAGDPAGLTVALAVGWPAAYRLAVGLCGHPGPAGAVAARVLDRAAVVAPRWATAEQARRWFTRYTVLAARGLMSNRDAAAPAAGELTWLVPLTSQQREAIVLHHGLGLGRRDMALAMDCSTQAAGNHLAAAVAQLRGTGPLDEWTAGLPATLAAIVPPPTVLSADVARAVGRRRWSVWVRRSAVGLVAVGLAVAVAYLAWRVWPMLVF